MMQNGAICADSFSRINQTQMSYFESLWCIESWLKKTQNIAKWLKRAVATVTSIFISHLHSVMYKIIGSTLKLVFYVIFILDLNTH